MLISELAGRDIAILGAGREGLSAWRWFRRHLPEKQLTVYDEDPAETALRALAEDPATRLVAGPFDRGRLARHEVLIRSPGISPYRDAFSGLRFTSASNRWFANHPREKTIGITGTKGKSTTAALTAHLLRAEGLEVELAGNIGRPLLDCEGLRPDWWVIELSSYQLADLQAAPNVAAILNLSDEHLDWHGGSEAYRRDKLRLAEMSSEGPLVANGADRALVAALAGRENVRWFGRGDGYHVVENELWRGRARMDGIPRSALPGSHNLANLAAALTILETTGTGLRKLINKLETFKGLPHRFQYLGEIEGVRFINDSLATTPVATLAALRALKEERVILLAGGLDRGLDWGPSAAAMREFMPHAVICLPDNGPHIARSMTDAGLVAAAGIQCVSGLEEAMNLAVVIAGDGDTVLLSPGAPSFPHFRDYAERGERFAELAGLTGGKSEETAGVG